VNCLAIPFATLGLDGVTPIDTKVGAVTVRSADPETPPSVAEIVVEPMLAEVTKPDDPDALLIEAVAGIEEDQVTEVVRFRVELSV